LDFIKFSNYIYYFSNIEKNKELPKKILNEFKKLKVPIEEAKYLNGINDQYNSESIIHQLKSELDEKGVIFCSFDEAIKNHSDLVKKYFTKLVSLADNKYAALNTAVFSGGSFIYVPQNVKLDKPLQAYFRINKQSMGQFERTLIICDKNSSLHYIEGCTAPIYDKNNLHAAVVEVFVEENAKCRYTTIQN
jgi:Fe-S cluster assembly protein SufB